MSPKPTKRDIASFGGTRSVSMPKTGCNWSDGTAEPTPSSGIRVSNMRRIDSAPTRDILVKLLHNDALGRNGDLAEFAGILKSIEGGFSLFVDADWGSGKTFFVRQLACILEEVNPFLESR